MSKIQEQHRCERSRAAESIAFLRSSDNAGGAGKGDSALSLFVSSEETMHWSGRRRGSSWEKADTCHVACDGSHKPKDYMGRNQIASNQLVRSARSVEQSTRKREHLVVYELALLAYRERMQICSAPL